MSASQFRSRRSPGQHRDAVRQLIEQACDPFPKGEFRQRRANDKVHGVLADRSLTTAELAKVATSPHHNAQTVRLLLKHPACTPSVVATLAWTLTHPREDALAPEATREAAAIARKYNLEASIAMRAARRLSSPERVAQLLAAVALPEPSADAHASAEPENHR